MQVAVTQLWDKKYHGGGDNSIIRGHHLNLGTINLDEFLRMSKKDIPSYTKFNLINVYDIDEYSLAEIHTYKINIIKRRWRKYLGWKKRLKTLRYRRLYGKYPRYSK